MSGVALSTEAGDFFSLGFTFKVAGYPKQPGTIRISKMLAALLSITTGPAHRSATSMGCGQKQRLRVT